MASYQIHLMGQNQPLCVDLPYADLGDLMTEASRTKFLAGHLTVADNARVRPPRSRITVIHLRFPD